MDPSQLPMETQIILATLTEMRKAQALLLQVAVSIGQKIDILVQAEIDRKLKLSEETEDG